MASSLSAAQAAHLLGITRATLYAYVSRGLIRSEPGREPRERRYLAEDVEQLLTRREMRRNPAHMVRKALHWGAPLLDSSLTLIRDGRLYYRGLDAIELATSRRIEDVASLLWLGRLDAAGHLFAEIGAPEPAGGWLSELSMLEAFQAALPFAGAADLAAHDLRPEAVSRTGARILGLLTTIAARCPCPRGPLSDVLAQAWTGTTAAATLLDQALILSADHELNVSSFTVRCVASAASTPYAAVAAGLAALQGHKHGGAVERAEALLREAEEIGAREALASRLRRGDPWPGFGHPLYPDGDPRSRSLLESLLAACSHHPAADVVRELWREAESGLSLGPNLDFSLAALARVLELPKGAGLGLFALGRTVGWVGHAVEEYAADRLIRPRARYTGPPPMSG